MLSLWSHFETHVGDPESHGYLAHAVRGFFANGGRRLTWFFCQSYTYRLWRRLLVGWPITRIMRFPP